MQDADCRLRRETICYPPHANRSPALKSPVLAAAVRALPFSPALHQRERACEPWRQSPPLRECIPITVKETELKRLSARDWRSVASLGE
jgi:hypothetical protein